MQIDVKLFGILRDQVPDSDKGLVKVALQDGSSVEDLLNELEISRRVGVSINEDIEADEKYILLDGDEATIFTQIGGG